MMSNIFRRGCWLIFCVLSLILLVSCAREQSSSVKIVQNVEISDTLHGKLAIDPEKNLFAPWSFAVCGNVLLTYTSGKEYLFDLWDLTDNFRHITAFGCRGRAANEFHQVDHNSLLANENSFSVYCTNNSYKTVQIKGDTLFSVSTLSGFAPQFDIDRVMRINDSIFTSTSSNLNYEFMRTNLNTGEVTYFGKITDEWFCSSLPEGEMRAAMSSNRYINPSTGAMAVFYTHFKKMRIYDSFQNLIHDVDVQIEPYDRCYDGHQVKGSYLFPYATSRNIYVICCKDKNYREATESELQIWDWDGNLQSRYVLDKGIVRLVYYPKRNVVLGKTSNDELYEFQLP